MHRKWWQVGDHPIYGFETLAFYSVDVHGKVLDGPGKVHFIVPGTCGLFGDYVNHM